MNIDRLVEDRIRAWLEETAPGPLPDRVLNSTFAQTRSLGQTSGSSAGGSRGRWPFRSCWRQAWSPDGHRGRGWVRQERLGPGRGPHRRAVIPQVWHADDSVAATIARDPSDDRDYYWRAQAYDQIDLQQHESEQLENDRAGRRRKPVRRHGGRCRSDRPAPLHFHRPARNVQGGDGVVTRDAGPGRWGRPSDRRWARPAYFATIDRQAIDGAPYTVTAMVPVTGDGPGMRQYLCSSCRRHGDTRPRSFRCTRRSSPGCSGRT